jgi:hypothetical protein
MKKNNYGLIFSFLLILILCWIGFRFLYENDYINHVPRISRHAYNFSWLALTGLIGYWGWHNYKVTWVKPLWLFSYSGVIILMITLGIIDLVIGTVSANFKDIIGYTRFFFTSPMPFMILWFFAKYIHNKEKEKN